MNEFSTNELFLQNLFFKYVYEFYNQLFLPLKAIISARNFFTESTVCSFYTVKKAKMPLTSSFRPGVFEQRRRLSTSLKNFENVTAFCEAIIS